MLPKVATQLLHSTTRAAVAAQNQSHHTLRNVLHSSSSSSPAGARAGPSSSGGSSNGPGPGGQKYTGSRFQSGYGGAGRAVTQANAMSSQDTSVAPTDEEEQDLVISHRVSLNTSSRKRPRSYSLSSSSSPSPNAPPAGILKTVQLHARSRHAFTAALSPDEQDAAVAPPAPALVRRNSTSSSPPSPRLVAAEEAAALPPLHSSATAPLPPLSATALDSADPAAPQTVEPPRPPPESAAVHAIRRAQMAGNVNGVAQAIREHLVDTSASLSVRDFNIAIEALREARQKDQSLTLLLQTYGSMLKKGVLPNLQTYVELILAIGDRDNEIHTAITTIRSRGPVSKSNAQKIERLQAENTFDSAMKLFETINTPEYLKSLRMHVFVALLRLCANHGRQDAAVHVLSALERTQLTPSAAVFRHMIRVYATPTSVDNAEIIFKDFLDRASSGKLLWKAPAIDIDQSRRQYLQVYNEMVSTYFVAGRPDKAVELLERMMSSTAAPEFAQVDTPHPAPSTYTAIISGFIRSGDLDTAITWFQRLLAQQTVAGKPFECSTAVLRPDGVAWHAMIEALGDAGRLDELNELFLTLLECAPNDQLTIRDADREIVYVANVRVLSQLSPEQLVSTTMFLANHVVAPHMDVLQLAKPLWQSLVSAGLFQEALSVSKQLGVSTGDVAHAILQSKESLSFDFVLGLTRLGRSSNLLSNSVRILHTYGQARAAAGSAEELATSHALTAQDWTLLLECAVMNEISSASRPKGYAFKGLVSLLEDMASAGSTLIHVPAALSRRVAKTVFVKKGAEGVQQIFAQLGAGFVQVLDGMEGLDTPASASPTISSAGSHFSAETALTSEPEQRLTFDKNFSQQLEEKLSQPSSRERTLEADAFFHASYAQGVVPTPFAVGRLIQSLGRIGAVDRVREAYTAAQAVLHLLEGNKRAQSTAWFAVENSMIVGLAHAGDLESAHVHRMRILELGGAPTADAYGALILYVKDTTDDTSNALALFHESQTHQVVPNLYLYNNIISKLAKARKADHALQLFEEMKTHKHTQPSSITYGAVIGACARVGDVESAENLFAEMIASPLYRPRVPPFNTMMQLYTTTRPNRERALHYYQQMRQSRVSPSAYTYKLLMDAYGRIEPVDIPRMEQIWEALRQDPTVDIQGNHFATLINAYGCVQKDLDKALSVFASIPSIPGAPPRDALVFEAVINTLVAHRRTDLMPQYVGMMHREGVHMTAYIANFLIKGYADVGDMDQARLIFESLVDPPSGVAAVGNHAPHEPSVMSMIDPAEPVYREPSTWEVMVRAELGCGKRENANALLERLATRCYPEAVYNRISGILVDHSTVV